VLEVFAGLRYNDLEATVDFNLPELGNDSKGDSWIDPIVGSRMWLPLSESFTFIGRADIGGFGVGSDLTWQLGAYFQWQSSGSVSIIAGYRYLVMDYEDGKGAKRFAYDMTLQGPVLGLSWGF